MKMAKEYSVQPNAWHRVLSGLVKALVLASWLAGGGAAVSQQGGDQEREYPGAPESHVLDEAEVLDQTRREKLVATLLRSAEEEDVHVFLRTLKSLDEGEFPSERARDLAVEWIPGREEGAVIVFVQDLGRFGVWPSGKLSAIDEENILRDLDEQYDELLGKRRNTAQTVREATLDLDYQVRLLVRDNRERMRVLGPIRKVALVAGGILAVILLLLVLREVKLHNSFDRKYMFPVGKAALRLGAPHGGGNMAVIQLREQPDETATPVRETKYPVDSA